MPTLQEIQPVGGVVPTGFYDALPAFDIRVHELRVHYVDVGDGPVVLLVHGSPISSLAFRHQIVALSESHRVIAIDLPGFGQSEAPAGGAGFHDQTQALRGLLDQLSIERYDMVVHDWGGPVGMASAAMRPGELARTVFINTSMLTGFEPPKTWLAYRIPRALPRLGQALLVDLNPAGQNLISVFLPGMLAAAKRSKELRRRYQANLRARVSRQTVMRLESLDGYAAAACAIESQLGTMMGDKMILWGTPDPYFLEPERKRMQARFPHARVELLPGGGHFPMEDAAETTTSALVDFLRS